MEILQKLYFGRIKCDGTQPSPRSLNAILNEYYRSNELAESLGFAAGHRALPSTRANTYTRTTRQM